MGGVNVRLECIGRERALERGYQADPDETRERDQPSGLLKQYGK